MAQSAAGTATFTGTSGSSIPKGTRISTGSTQTQAAIVFTTDTDATIAAGQTMVDVAITAEEAGTSGNVAAGTITFLVSPINGITSVTNAAATSGGANEESDADLLDRYLTKVRNPSAGGNKADYVNWALEVAGVGGVSVVPVRDGPGTVSVAIINADKAPADQTLIDAVQTYIDDRKPIGADATVESAVSVLINVSATLTIAAGYDAASVTAAAEQAIDSYLKSLAFADNNDVLYVRIGDAIIGTTGVQDYSGMTVNGGTANIVIDVQQVGVKGTVTFT